MFVIHRCCTRLLRSYKPSSIWIRPSSQLGSRERLFKNSQQALEIQNYNEDGFTINHIYYPSPVILLPKMTLLWKAPSSIKEMTKKDVSIFAVCFPSLEIVIIGTGIRIVMISQDLRHYFKELGIMIEVMDTINACSTFNMLSQEGRLVGACLLPIERKS